VITLVVRDKEYRWRWSRDVVEILRKFARFDGNTKTWHADTVPCWAASVLGVEQCSDVRWYRGYAYISNVSQEIIERETCYTIERWKPMTCEDMCSSLSCLDRCKTEGWRKVAKVKEKICLAKKTEKGDWAVPRGLVLRVAKNVHDFAEFLKPLETNEVLRDYQIQVVNNLWSQLRKIGCGTVMMATGAGKSFTAGYLAKQLERSGYTVVMTALQVDLVNQLVEFARRFGVKNVYGVTIQTLYRRLAKRNVAEDAEDEEDRELLNAYADEIEISDDIVEILRRKDTAVILDEAHHVPAETVKRVVTEIGDGWGLRIGLTATPWRNDGRDLEIYAVLGDVVEPRISSSYLISRNYAVPVEIRVVNAPSCDVNCADDGAKGFMCIRKALVECDKRNKLIVKLAIESKKPVLVTTKLVKHAELLYRLIKQTGASVALATGAVKGEKRKEIYRNVLDGRIDILVATTIAEEGLDLPPLQTMILALADKSRTRTLQRAGRLVRPWPGKETGVLYEIRDNVEFFDEHLEQRLKLYATEPMWKITIDERRYG